MRVEYTFIRFLLMASARSEKCWFFADASPRCIFVAVIYVLPLLVLNWQCCTFRRPDDVGVIPLGPNFQPVRYPPSSACPTALDELLGNGQGALLLAVKLNRPAVKETDDEVLAIFRDRNERGVSVGDVLFDSVTLKERVLESGDVVYGLEVNIGEGQSHVWKVHFSLDQIDSLIVSTPAMIPIITSPSGGISASRGENLTVHWEGLGKGSVFVIVSEEYEDGGSLFPLPPGAVLVEEADRGKTLISNRTLQKFKPNSRIQITTLRFTKQEQRIRTYNMPVHCVVIFADRVSVLLR